MAGDPDDWVPESAVTESPPQVTDNDIQDWTAESAPAPDAPKSLLARTLAKLAGEGQAAGLGAERLGLGLGNLADRLPDVTIPGTSDADLQAFDAAHRDVLSKNRAGEVVGQTIPGLAALALTGGAAAPEVAAEEGAGSVLPMALRWARSILPGAVSGYATAPVGQQGASAAVGGGLGAAGEVINPATLSKAGQAVQNFLSSDVGKDALAAAGVSGVGKLFLPLAQGGAGFAQKFYQKMLPRALGATTSLQNQYQQLAEGLRKTFGSAYNDLLSRWAAKGAIDLPTMQRAAVAQVLTDNSDMPMSVLRQIPGVVSKFVGQAEEGARGLTGNSLQNAYINLGIPGRFTDALGDAVKNISPSYAESALGSVRNVFRQLRRQGLSPEDADKLDLVDNAYSGAQAILKNKVGNSTLMHTLEAAEPVIDLARSAVEGNPGIALKSTMGLLGLMAGGKGLASKTAQSVLKSGLPKSTLLYGAVPVAAGTSAFLQPQDEDDATGQ